MERNEPQYTNNQTLASEIWVIVPAKPLAEAKSRLADLLPVQQRQNLAFHLLQRSLQTLTRLKERVTYVKVLVVSSDPILLQEADKCNFVALFDADFANEGDSTVRLNKALTRAARWCYNQSPAASLLILPADLPCLSLEDLAKLLELATNLPENKKLLIVSDNAKNGTNALFIQPPDLLNFNFYFGPDSFAAHLKQAQLVVQPQICYFPNLAFDLDYPQDFNSLSLDLQQRLLAPIS